MRDRDSESSSARISGASPWLFSELVPVEGGETGFLILLATVAVHLWIGCLGPDAHGHLFRGGVYVEALGQSGLIVAPGLALYAGMRAVRRDPEAVLPYLNIVVGGLLAVLTWGACLAALVLA